MPLISYWNSCYYFNRVFLESSLCLLSFAIRVCSNIWANNSFIFPPLPLMQMWCGEHIQRPGGFQFCSVLPSAGSSHFPWYVCTFSQPGMYSVGQRVLRMHIQLPFDKSMQWAYHSLLQLTQLLALPVKYLSSLLDYC